MLPTSSAISLHADPAKRQRNIVMYDEQITEIRFIPVNNGTDCISRQIHISNRFDEKRLATGIHSFRKRSLEVFHQLEIGTGHGG